MAVRQRFKRLSTERQTVGLRALELRKTQSGLRLVRGVAFTLFALASVSGSRFSAQNVSTPAQPNPAKLVLPAGVERLCSISFDKDEKRPARVEDEALPCVEQVAKVLRDHPDKKVVLVGVSDPVKDHEEKDAGEDRGGEDMTGLDIRYEDTSAYRAVNSKDYIVRFYGIDPARLIPTTNENRHGQDVVFYLVPGDANFLHNYLDTTRTNEHNCTVKPCYDPREESDTPQPRERIQPKPAH